MIIPNLVLCFHSVCSGKHKGRDVCYFKGEKYFGDHASLVFCLMFLINVCIISTCAHEAAKCKAKSVALCPSLIPTTTYTRSL